MRVDFDVRVRDEKIESDKRLHASLRRSRGQEGMCRSRVWGRGPLENLRFHIEEEGKVKREDGSSVDEDDGERPSERHDRVKLDCAPEAAAGWMSSASSA